VSRLRALQLERTDAYARGCEVLRRSLGSVVLAANSPRSKEVCALLSVVGPASTARPPRPDCTGVVLLDDLHALATHPVVEAPVLPRNLKFDAWVELVPAR
jgi:hypothetical protein